MARIGLIDVDGRKFPNLALMRISSYHKSLGDTVEWWDGFQHYDRVYKSKIFSDSYGEDEPDPVNTDEIVKGGTGYAISTVKGIEKYDKAKDEDLPQCIETMRPDYSIYPDYGFAVSMTSRGCPRGCAFCHVAGKEGRKAHKVADVEDFWTGQKEIKVCDPNIMALPTKDREDLFKQYNDTGAWIDFNQGIDIRLIKESDIEFLSTMRLEDIHFAWDNPADDLEPKLRMWQQRFKGKTRHAMKGTVFILVNFNSTMEENLQRIEVVRDCGMNPYVMVYDKPSAAPEILQLQRWANNKFIFKSCSFEEYDSKNRGKNTVLDGQMSLL